MKIAPVNVLAPKVMYLCTKFEEPSFILSQDIVWKPPSIENRSTDPVTLKSGSRSTICNPMLAPKVMYMHTKFTEPSFTRSQDIVRKRPSTENKSTVSVNFSDIVRKRPSIEN